MSTSTPSLTRSSLTLAAGTMASRLLGVVRQSLIVLAIGQGLVGNAFQTANNLPNVIYMLIAGGVLNSVLVPQIVKAMRLPDGGREYTDRIITLSTAGMLVVTAACTAAAGWFVFLYAGNLALNRQVGAMFLGELFKNRLDYAVGVFNGPRRSFDDSNSDKDAVLFLNSRPFLKSETFPALHYLNLGGSINGGFENNAPQPGVFRTANDQTPNSTVASTSFASDASSPAF